MRALTLLAVLLPVLVTTACSMALAQEELPPEVAAFLEQLRFESWQDGEESWQDRCVAMDRVVRMEPDAQDPYLAALSTLGFSERESALIILAKRGGDALPWALAWLRETAPRGDAHRVFKEIGDPAEEALAEMLSDASVDIRLAAADSLGGMYLGPVATEKLCDALSDDSAAVRLRACQVLARASTPTEEMLEALTAALDDPDMKVVFASARTLSGEGELKRAMPRLAELVKSDDAEVVSGAAGVLSFAAQREAWRSPPPQEMLVTLVGQLEARNKAVRRWAAIALIALGDYTIPVIPALVAQLGTQSEFYAARALMAIGEEEHRSAAAQVLVAALDSEDEELQGRACSYLALDQAALELAAPKLVEMYESGSKSARASALDALTTAGHIVAVRKHLHDTESFGWDSLKFSPFMEMHKGGVPRLVEILREVPDELKPKACRVLPLRSSAWDADVLPALIDALSADDADLRLAAVRGLTGDQLTHMPELADPERAADAVAALLDDPDDRVRAFAAIALVWWGRGDDARATLIEMSDQPPLEFSHLIGTALIRVDEVEHAVAALTVSLDRGSGAAYALGGLGEDALPAVPTLIRILQAQQAEDTAHLFSRTDIVRALGAIGGDLALAALTGALGDDGDPLVRASAARALANWVHQSRPDMLKYHVWADGPAPIEALPALVAALSDGEPMVRTQAASALVTLGQAAQVAVPRLREMVDDPYENVAEAAMAALKAITGE